MQARTPIANVKKDRLDGITYFTDVVRCTATGAARQKDFSTKCEMIARGRNVDAQRCFRPSDRYAKWERTICCQATDHAISMRSTNEIGMVE